MSSPDPRSNRVHDPADELEQLMADLEALVDARLVVEIRELGQPSRYGLSRSGRNLASRSDPDGHVYPIEDWPEPCPACLAREGFDGGGRCNRCHIAWPPEM